MRLEGILVAPGIVHDISYESTINQDSHFAWQAQYLVRCEVMPVARRIVNEVSYVSTINHDSHFAWQAQYWVRCEGDACCSTHCT